MKLSVFFDDSMEVHHKTDLQVEVDGQEQRRAHNVEVEVLPVVRHETLLLLGILHRPLSPQHEKQLCRWLIEK